MKKTILSLCCTGGACINPCFSAAMNVAWLYFLLVPCRLISPYFLEGCLNAGIFRILFQVALFLCFCGSISARCALRCSQVMFLDFAGVDLNCGQNCFLSTFPVKCILQAAGKCFPLMMIEMKGLCSFFYISGSQCRRVFPCVSFTSRLCGIA